MRKTIALFMAFIILLSFSACSAKAGTVQDNIMTISFEYGERTGPYSGDMDEKGLPHGYGTFTSQKPDGTSWTYTGAWDHGHWNGQGLSVWSTGESYSGFYANDVINGYGVHTLPDGIVISGNFADRTPVGYCAVYLSGDYAGYVFWGYFVGNNADGILYSPNKDATPATYQNGEITVTPEPIPEFTISETTSEDSPDDETAPTEETVPTTEITSGMSNALRAAKNYLSIMPFSYSGLVKQLEYEKYTHEEAIYAVDNCGADWYEQAAKAAKNYLDLMPFSRGGLIDQLEYEGYTSEQATYAAEQNGL